MKKNRKKRRTRASGPSQKTVTGFGIDRVSLGGIDLPLSLGVQWAAETLDASADHDPPAERPQPERGLDTGELLVEFQDPVIAPDGTVYVARARGGPADDGTERWHGWIEFVPVGGGAPLRTARETTQPNRTCTEYWATGLRPLYLQGALQRTIGADEPAPARAVPHAGESSNSVEERDRPRPQPIGFARVGGMADLKAQVRRIIDATFLRQEQARRYGVVRNGILLYGPPGCGKTFFAEAIAEEFGLHFLRVPLGSAITKYVGAAPEAIEALFSEARSKTPCLLFFDEFDAVAAKRQDTPVLQEQQMVNALLQQLEAHRETPGVLIVAATNRFEDLDPAVVRDGRFDYKIKVAAPDFDARLAILRSQVRGRPHGRKLELEELAHDLDGFSAAQVRSLVDEAALAALDAGQPIRREHLRAAYAAQIKANSYGGATLSWNDLVLPDDLKKRLQLIGQMIENAQIVRELGVTPPSGVLLSGPPGTGKTTIARVLASQAQASFFSINAADIFSKWLGESEQHVKELFDRARERPPAIVFIDEIDAITERRGEGDSGGDRVRNGVVNMFLAQIDGLDSSGRILVIGATNRPELIDEALVRPGRLGERIEIRPPDHDGRRVMLELFSRNMRMAPDVDINRLAGQTEGASGALLKGLCTLAGRNALARALDARGIAPADSDGAPAVTQEDFEKAYRELSSADTSRRPIGFSPPPA